MLSLRRWCRSNHHYSVTCKMVDYGGGGGYTGGGNQNTPPVIWYRWSSIWRRLLDPMVAWWWVVWRTTGSDGTSSCRVTYGGPGGLVDNTIHRLAGIGGRCSWLLDLFLPTILVETKVVNTGTAGGGGGGIYGPTTN